MISLDKAFETLCQRAQIAPRRDMHNETTEALLASLADRKKLIGPARADGFLELLLREVRGEF